MTTTNGHNEHCACVACETAWHLAHPRPQTGYRLVIQADAPSPTTRNGLGNAIDSVEY